MNASSHSRTRVPAQTQGRPMMRHASTHWRTRIALSTVLYGASCFAQEAKSQPVLREPMVRLTGEYSQVRFPTRYTGGYRADDTATQFSVERIASRPAQGLRLEGGLVAHHGGVVGIPFLSVSVAQVESQTVGLEIVGIEHPWRSHAWWWSVGLGAEVQTLERMLCTSAELGVAGVAEDVEPRQPGLSVQEDSTSGAYGRVAVSFRMPLSAGLAVGGTAAAATYVLTWQPPATRVGFGIFLEWNGGGS